MNRVQFEEAITKVEKTVKKIFCKMELNDFYLYVRRERSLHPDDTADELADKMCRWLRATGKHYGVKVGLLDEE